MALREGQAAETLFHMLFEVLGYLLIEPFSRHFSATEEARDRGQKRLSGAAKTPHRSAASSFFRLLAPTVPRRFLA